MPEVLVVVVAIVLLIALVLIWRARSRSGEVLASEPVTRRPERGES